MYSNHEIWYSNSEISEMCVCTILPNFWGREFTKTLETSTINTRLLSHQSSKVCSQETMPGDRNSILRSPCISFTFFWGYCRLLRVFAFYVQCVTVAGVSQPSSNVAKETQFHKGLKVIKCCLCSPGKSGEAHPHLVAGLTQPFVIKFNLHSCLHSFQECFSSQTKSRIYDWNNSISD